MRKYADFQGVFRSYDLPLSAGHPARKGIKHALRELFAPHSTMSLHPQARAFLDAAAAEAGLRWEEMTPAQCRATYEGWKDLYGVGPELSSVENQVVSGSIPIRIYRPSLERPLPAVMYFHGGGWVLGSLETHDTLCRHLARQSGCAFISVDYRLAPEHSSPAAHDDCFAATEYVAQQADALGLDTARLAVCGDSAGGNLAATVALHARDTGAPKLHSQWLLYPTIEPQFDAASYERFSEGYGLTRRDMQWFWDQYAPTAEMRANPLVVPTCAADLSGLPPAHIITAEYDVLRDEGEGYAAKLQAAGVPTALERWEGTLHGFIHFAEAFDDAKRAIADLGRRMKAALHS